MQRVHEAIEELTDLPTNHREKVESIVTKLKGFIDELEFKKKKQDETNKRCTLHNSGPQWKKLEYSLSKEGDKNEKE